MDTTKTTKTKRRRPFKKRNIVAALVESGLDQREPPLSPAAFDALSRLIPVERDYHRQRYVEWVLEELRTQAAA